VSTAALALTLIRCLPVSPAVLLARLLVLSYLAASRSIRIEIRHNYQTVFGRDRPGFWVENGWQIGRNLALMARMDSVIGRSLIDKAAVGAENRVLCLLEQELQEESAGRRLVMVSFHFGMWEYLPFFFRRRGHRVALAVGRQRYRDFDSLLRGMRFAQGVRLVRSAGELFDKEQGGLVGFMLDNTGRGSMTFADSDQVVMRLPAPAFRVARIDAGREQAWSDSKGGVVPAFCILERGRLRVRIYPEGDENHVLGCLMAEVRRRPADWVFWGKARALKERGQGVEASSQRPKARSQRGSE